MAKHNIEDYLITDKPVKKKWQISNQSSGSCQRLGNETYNQSIHPSPISRILHTFLRQ